MTPPPVSSHNFTRATAGRLMVLTFWNEMKESIRIPLWCEALSKVGVQLRSPWVASGSAYRRVRPERSHPAAVARRLLRAGLGSPYKKQPCPCSVVSCGSRTGRLLPDAAPGGSSAGCGRWCSVVEHRPLQFDLLLKETNMFIMCPFAFLCVRNRKVDLTVL